MKNCLVVTASFFPSFRSGGPVRSLSNLLTMIDKAYDIDIVTLDRDLADSSVLKNIKSNAWQNNFSNCNTFYMSPDINIFRKFKKIFHKNTYDIIYLNSFFDYKFTMRFLLLISLGVLHGKTILLAPRGELTSGAMSLKRYKKTVYLSIFKFLRLHKKVTFHFTSKEEYEEGKKYLRDIKYKIIPNMHELPPEYAVKEKTPDSLNLLFLSRVSKKKNLITVLNSLKRIENSKLKIQFVIVGDYDDKSYWLECLEIINSLPENITVIIKGALSRNLVSEEMINSHAFILPTLNENYGHAIVEGMINSNIVIISNQTPWSELSDNGGYVGSPFDEDFYKKSIVDASKMAQSEFNKKTLQSYSYCFRILESNELKVVKLFE
jgi:glycosyltransferase involved in cell wall biosynthesis